MDNVPNVTRSDTHNRWNWRVLAACAFVIAFVALVVLQLKYQDGSPSWRTIWAEDGQVFVAQARRDALAALFRPHGGYALLVPRLAAIPTAWIALDRVAQYLAVVGCVITALAAGAVYVLTSGVIRSQVLRVVLAASVALLPVMAFENLANLTNTIWALTFVCFWALLSPAATRRDAVFRAACVFLATASAGLCVIFVPVAAYALYRRRTPDQRIVVGAYGAALVFQAVIYLTTSVHGPSGPADGVIRLFVARVLAGSVLGEEWASDLFDQHGYWPLYLAAALVVGLVLFLVLTTRGPSRELGSIAVGYAAVAFFAPLLLRGTAPMRLVAGMWTSNSARYVGLAILLLLSGVFVMVPEVRLAAPAVPRVLTAVLAAQFVVIVAFAWPATNYRSYGPEWRPELAAAVKRCRHGADQVLVPITPAQLNWYVRVHCSDV